MKAGTLKMKYLRRVWALKYNLLQITSATLIFLLATLCCVAKRLSFHSESFDGCVLFCRGFKISISLMHKLGAIGLKVAKMHLSSKL